MSDTICEFCNTSFLNKYNLDKHKKTAKFCLKLQNENIEDLDNNLNCKFCNKNFLRKHCYDNHISICKQKISTTLKNQEDFLNEFKAENKKLIKIIDTLKNEIKLKDMSIKSKDEIIIMQDRNIDEQKLKIKDLEQELKNLYEKTIEDKNITQKSIESLASKAIENTGNKTINNNNSKNIQNVINNLVPLTKEYMEEQSKFFGIEHVRHGTESIAKFAKDYSFKDRIAITDASRHKFVFKDEDGTTIYDSHGVQLTYKFIQVNKEVIIKALEEYLNLVNKKLLNACDEQNIDDIAELQKEMCSLMMIKRLIEEGETSDNIKHYNRFKEDFIKYLTKIIDAVNKNDL